MTKPMRIERVESPSSDLLAKLTELEREAFGAGGLFNQWLMVPLINHGLVFALYEGSDAIGVAELMRDWHDPDSAYLYGVCIRGDRRGGGRGQTFMREVLRQVGEQGIRRVTLTVDPGNEPARHLYEQRFGFRVTGHVKAAFGPGEDRLLMEAHLREMPAG